MNANDPSIEVIMGKYKVLSKRLKEITSNRYYSLVKGHLWLHKDYYEDPRYVTHK